MLNFKSPTNHEPKCNVTHGSMGHIDRQQPPTKRKPFATILGHSFIHKIDLLLPAECYEIFKKEVLKDNDSMSPKYSRVVMPLKDLLTGEFFNEYIKKGNIMMLSEGRVGVDNVYMLKDGILTLHLEKESYERAGLVGKPDGVKGSRGTKPWWVIEINLRLPSMLHGRKAFDRILYAFRNVLTAPVKWLFHDINSTGLEIDPMETHSPVRKTIVPQISQEFEAAVPSLKPPAELDPKYCLDFEDYAVDINEWLSMALIESPRLQPDEKISSFLSRYSPPGDTEPGSLVKISWQGFLSPSWSHKSFVDILLAIPKEQWFCYSITGFADDWGSAGHHSLIVKLPDTQSDYMLWDVY